MASFMVTQDVQSLTFGNAVGGERVSSKAAGPSLGGRIANAIVNRQTIQMKSPPKKKTGTLRLGGPKKGGTKIAPKPSPGLGTIARKTTSMPLFGGEKAFRSKQAPGKPTPKILSRLEELKLLSKLEKAGLLSQLEKSGLTLSKIESLGLLSTAESLGLLSAAGNRSTPPALYFLALLLFAAGPAAVYFLPDSTDALIYGQYAAATVAALGGAAAFGGATLLSSLQK